MKKLMLLTLILGCMSVETVQATDKSKLKCPVPMFLKIKVLGEGKHHLKGVSAAELELDKALTDGFYKDGLLECIYPFKSVKYPLSFKVTGTKVLCPYQNTTLRVQMDGTSTYHGWKTGPIPIKLGFGSQPDENNRCQYLLKDSSFVTAKFTVPQK